MNTMVFSNITLGNLFHWQCNMSIMTTVLGQLGFMLATGLRIWRVSQIYNAYINYLKIQKTELSKPSGELHNNFCGEDSVPEYLEIRSRGSTQKIGNHERKF